MFHAAEKIVPRGRPAVSPDRQALARGRQRRDLRRLGRRTASQNSGRGSGTSSRTSTSRRWSKQYIDGRELNVGSRSATTRRSLCRSPRSTSPGLTDDMHRIVSYEAKWMHGSIAYEGTNGVCPARSPRGQEAEDEGDRRCAAFSSSAARLRPDRLPADAQTASRTSWRSTRTPTSPMTPGFARSARATGWTFRGDHRQDRRERP